MKAPDWNRIVHIALIYAGALVVGVVFDWLNVPLPWMIGAMVFATALRMGDLPVPVYPVTRPMGQMVVAASVGLSFTPEAVAAMGSLLVPMVIAAILTVVMGFLVAAVLMRMTHLDVVTASLASVPVGPVESGHLATRYGVAPGPVVFTQTLRIMLLVLTIPPILVMLDGTIADPTAALRDVEWSFLGVAVLIVFAIAGTLVAQLLRIANPFFVGALAGSAVAAALSMPITAFPYPVLVTAQIFLGVWLGAVFDRALMRRAGGFIPAAFVSTVLMVSLCAAMGLGLSAITGVSWQVMVLATAPGSVTEMALTAKVLQEGIAIVTAFHLVRVFIIMPSAPLLFSVTARLARRYGLGPEQGNDAAAAGDAGNPHKDGDGKPH